MGQILVSCSEEPNPGGLTAPLTFTTDQINTLQTNGYLNIENGNEKVMVFYTNNSYSAYTRTCPHEQGSIDAVSSTSAKCNRHSGQFFDISNNAKGNGFRTSSNLAKYTVNDNGKGTITISS